MGGGGTLSHLRSCQNLKRLPEFLVDLTGPGGSLAGTRVPVRGGVPKALAWLCSGQEMNHRLLVGVGQGRQVVREDGTPTGLLGPHPLSLLACGQLPG